MIKKTFFKLTLSVVFILFQEFYLTVNSEIKQEKPKGVSWHRGESYLFEKYSPEDIFLRVLPTKEYEINTLTKEKAERLIESTANVCNSVFGVIEEN